MTFFLITFLLMYGGMHFYILIRFKRSYNFSRQTSVFFSCWFLFATLSPILVRICEESGFDLTAKAIAWPGFTWMGFLFILVSILLLLDFISLTTALINHRRKASVPFLLKPDITAETALLLAIIISVYGFFEADNIQSRTITIESNKIPSTVGKLRIVQISDVHLGLIIREDRLKKMLQVVNAAKPDIVVSTGDLVDGRLSHLEGIKIYEKLTTMLAAVPAPLGKFAVIGNHEIYAGLQQSLDVTSAAGFRILRNEFVSLPIGLTISGIDDPAGMQMSKTQPDVSEAALLKSLPTEQFKLHLKHRPVVPSEFEGLFDLQLSGHTHRGQIFPFYLLTKFKFTIPSGTTNLSNGSKIHVSNGTGTWGPPIRFLAPPEVTIINIIPAAKPNKLQNNI